MITYRDSGVADRPHAAVVHHRLEDDPGYLGLAARAFVAWDAVHVDPWLIGCCVTSGQAHERESAGRQLLRAYERSCSHTIHVSTGGMARSCKFSVFGPMIMKAWRKQGMSPSRWLNQDCSTTADMV
jgi:hypothetical protein